MYYSAGSNGIGSGAIIHASIVVFGAGTLAGKVTPYPLESLEKQIELFEQEYIAIEKGEVQL